MPVRRRQFLQALGLGALAGATAGPGRVLADGGAFPTRVVFFIQPHAHVKPAWKLPLTGLPTDRFAEQSLVNLPREEFTKVLDPLYDFRSKLTVVEGLAHTSVLQDIVAVQRAGMMGDANNHNIGVAGMLSGDRAMQVPGAPCVGGARTLDQEIASRIAAPGRFGSRVYGMDYVVNAHSAPFSYLGAGEATPMVQKPATAFADLLGYYHPPSMNTPVTRAERLAAMRVSVLDSVAEEYRLVAATQGAEAKKKLESHRALVRDLELSLDSAPRNLASCDPTYDDTGPNVTQFMQLIRMALSCDLTRVVTFIAPVPNAPEFGYPASAHVHGDYAHASVKGDTSCGMQYSPLAEQAMTDLGVWYANHFAKLLTELDSVPEGSGTMLDHTVVVWLNELGSPTHRHHDTFVLMAGGANNFFRTGRYVRYPSNIVSPAAKGPILGPAHNRLYVSLLQAMGQTDTSFGMTEATGSDGSAISLRGALTELHRAG